LAAIIATLLEEDRCMIYEEIARNLEYQIIHSQCFNWDFGKKKAHCLLHDKTRSITQPLRIVFTNYKWGALPFPAYIPDMSSPEFCVFPKLN
jgi:hypothetical protein